MLMLHDGSDLGRKRLDVCLIGDDGAVVGRSLRAPGVLIAALGALKAVVVLITVLVQQQSPGLW
jgi:hypothetical protein